MKASRAISYLGVYAILLFVGGCDREELLRVASEKEATHILVELSENGVSDARKQSSTDRKASWLITVPKGSLDRARAVLVARNLPHVTSGGFDEMLGQTSLIPTAGDDRARLMRAVSGELARTLEMYDGVLEARVHVVLPERDSLRRSAATQPAPSAMVVIKHAANMKPATGENNGALPSEAEVKRMLAKSIEGVKAEDVAVQFTAAAERKLPEQRETPWYFDATLLAALAGTGIGIVAALIFMFWRQGRGGKTGNAAGT